MPGELNSPYRRDPFTGNFYPRWNEADEVHQAVLQESNGRVGFFLNEAPQLRIPSDFICMLLADEYDEYGTALRENARLDAPDTDEFRVDYDAEDYFGFGFVEVNASLAGSWFLVGYWGLGTPPRWETYYNARVHVSQDSAIEGDLIVGRKLAVVDEYDAEMFSAEGAVISAHGNRVRDVADAVADTDLVNLGDMLEAVANVQASIDMFLGWLLKNKATGQITEMAVGLVVSTVTWWAVGPDTNDLFLSTDGGLTWADTAEGRNYVSIAYGDENFVAVKANNISYNSGGGWTLASSITANWSSVRCNADAGVFVACAETGSNRIARSTDAGVSWSAITDAVAGAGQWKCIAYGDGVWVAMGVSAAMRSTDGGITWSAISGMVSYTLTSMAFGNGVFVAVTATSKKMIRSTDLGVTWSEVDIDIDVLPAAWGSVRISFNNGLFLAGGGSILYRSADDGAEFKFIYLPSGNWCAPAGYAGTMNIGANGFFARNIFT